MNAVINPLTALLDVCNGAILHSPSYAIIARNIVTEGVQAAACCGVSLNVEECLQRVHLVAEQTAGTVSSMLADIRKKNKTEIDFMNGYICKIGEKHGLSTPFNLLMTSLIHMKEQSIV